MGKGYDELDLNQRIAVEDFNSNLLVLSCAGSGKTRVITNKIAYAVEAKGYDPSSILAITFTKKASQEMVDRVKKLLGRKAERVAISTFHSFAFSLIREKYNWKALGYARIPDVVTDTLKTSIVSNFASKYGKSECTQDYEAAISVLKNLAIKPEETDRIRAHVKLDRIQDIYGDYEKALKERNCIDFDDMVILACRLLDSRPWIRREIESRFRLILVDEYQDTNGPQVDLLKKVKGKSTQLVVVGDDDQSIYGWRGANVGYILSFLDDPEFRPVRLVPLSVNYRCTRQIVQVAAAIVEGTKGSRMDKVLKARAGWQGPKPQIMRCNDEIEEAERIAEIIQSSPDVDTAILYRMNRQADVIDMALTRAMIEHSLKKSDHDNYDNRMIVHALSLMSLFVNRQNTSAFIYHVRNCGKRLNEDELKLMLSFDSDCIKCLDNANGNVVKSRSTRLFVEDFRTRYHELEKLLESDGGSMPVGVFVRALVQKFDLVRLHGGRHGRNGRISTDVQLFSYFLGTVDSDSQGRLGLEDYLTGLAIALGRNPGEKTDNASVKLMTIHSAKGLEFDRVFIVGLEEGTLPVGDAEHPDEERRLFYVAATRAKKELYLSYSLEHSDDNGVMRSSLPSPFLADIPPQLLDGLDGRMFDEIYRTEEEETALCAADIQQDYRRER